LTFTYEKDTSSTSNEGLTVQAWNGTEWRDLTTAAVSGTDADGSTGTRTAELTSQDTKIRFVMNDELDNGEYYYIDNVNIGYTTVTPSVDHVASFIENGAAISIAPAGPTITDTDDTVMESAKIVLTNAKAGDILAVGGLPSGIGYTLDTSVAGQITVNLSGNASLASYQAAIKAVTYQSTSDNPGADDRVIHVTVTDDHGNASNVATTTVHVTPTNDPFTAVDDHILTNVTDFSAIHIPNAALLYNDTNPDGDTLAVQSVSGPSGGTVVSGVTFDPTDPPSTVEVVKTYNFATAGAGTAKSFEVDIDGDSPLASLSMTGTSSSGYDNAHTLSASEYSQIATADDTRYRTADPGNGDNAVFWAQFTITENVADITKIDLKIEAIQDNSGGSSDGMEFGVWNYHTNGWQSIQEIRDTSSPDANFTFSITTHPEYYVGTDGKVTLVLFNEDDSGSGSNNQRISVDYVEVKVTSDVPAPPSHFTDGSFDYTATDGTTPDTGHVDVTGVVGSTIEGTASGEILLAGNGDDTLHGNGGNDYLIGGIGADILDGGNDNDILVGGAGIDKLTGGAGADHFRFEALSEGGDHIVDFQHGTDSIDLLLSSFSALAGPAGATVAPNDFSVQASADAAAHADIGTAHLAYYQGTSANDPGKLYYDADGGGDANRVLIAILDNHAQVTASDIHKV
jgi:Ca2+-binding RTX toxin-like protein